MEDFVTFEIALKLKDKGFNWICSHYYRTKCKDLFMVFPSEDWSNTEERINAPTISQVLNWLREEKKIYVALDFYRSNGNTKIWWIYSVRYIEDDSTEYIFGSSIRKSYEQAALAGIEYVLDNSI